jgi:poly(3-hydroxybutyrate) depolymerase
MTLLRPFGRSLALAATLLLFLSGCGPSDSGTPNPDAGQGDATDVPDGGDMNPLPECQESTPGAVSEISEIDFGKLAVVDANSSDLSGVGAAISDGSFEAPTPGSQAYGAYWGSVTPQENGSFSALGGADAVYAAVRIEADAPKTLVARGDAAQRIWVNGRRMTGDIYGFGDKRVPLRLKEGTNHIVGLFSTGRGPKFELFETSDSVFFNKQDITKPTLRVGSDRTQYVGMQTLNLSGHYLRDVKARVLEDDNFNATTIELEGLSADAVTQIPFKLEPKQAWQSADTTHTVTLQLESCAMETAWEVDVDLQTVARNSQFERTFRSDVDGSVQYYSVRPPSNFEADKDYGLVLSLHGASVEASGQANSYSQKDWAYIVVPTNRRRYGFDWEEWGHFNGMAAMEDARSQFNIDPTRIHVTGHSMGGHGTWHFGVFHPGTFASVAPSAGWSTYYNYGGRGQSPPNEPFQSARAHWETLEYMSNLEKRGAYILHGGDDRNVPVSEGERMRDAMSDVTDDYVWNLVPGKKHWWDGDAAEGTDAVDLPAMWTFMENHTLDPNSLDFSFKTPGPYYSPTNSYVTIQSKTNPFDDATITSEKLSDTEVDLTTENVRSMTLDGAALTAKGINEITIDGSTQSVTDGTMEIGPQSGKKVGQTGPMNQVYREPFCFVYSRDASADYKHFAAYLISVWSVRGNGHACAMPYSQLTDQVRQDRNIIYMGIPFEDLPNHESLPFSYSESAITVGGNEMEGAAGMFTFPEGDGMAIAWYASGGNTQLLGFSPFSSRSGLPDFYLSDSQGGLAAGYFDANWEYDSQLAGFAERATN